MVKCGDASAAGQDCRSIEIGLGSATGYREKYSV